MFWIGWRGLAAAGGGGPTFFALIEQVLQQLHHALRIRAFEFDKFRHHLCRRHIDHGLQRDKLADNRHIFRHENRLHVGHGKKRRVGLRWIDKHLEELRGLLRREVVELHEITHHLVVLRQHVGGRINRYTLGPGKLGGAENFHRFVVHRHKGIAVEQQRRLDEPDGLAAWNLARYNNGQRLPLGQHRIAHQALVGEHFVKAQNFIHRSVGKGEPHRWLGLAGLGGRWIDHGRLGNSWRLHDGRSGRHVRVRWRNRSLLGGRETAPHQGDYQ